MLSNAGSTYCVTQEKANRSLPVASFRVYPRGFRRRVVVAGVTLVGLSTAVGLAHQNACSDWNKPVFFHASTGRVEACLAQGLDGAARDEHGRTPLHYAGQYAKSAGFVAALVGAGADPNARSDKC